MGEKRPCSKKSLVYATQSIHKLLAGISQASQVLVQDSQTVPLDRFLFNEAYLMHTSTSPQYSIDSWAGRVGSRDPSASFS